MKGQLEQKTVMDTRLEQLERRLVGAERRARMMGVVVVFVVIGALALSTIPSVTAYTLTLEERVQKLEDLLVHFSRKDNNVYITGANLHVRNGMGLTATKNALGNLIVGYNEGRVRDGDPELVRTGSHNLIVGSYHSYSSYGGLVVGWSNRIQAPFASVSGGRFNTASGTCSSVSGGDVNIASAKDSSVSGGHFNAAYGESSSVSGGAANAANGYVDSISGGMGGIAAGEASSISGGYNGETGAFCSSVSGGSWCLAGGNASSVSGGNSRHIWGDNDWQAGDLFQDW